MKKNGFTLIELLAVIIILAVIALIATPIVLNVVDEARVKSAESSVNGYISAVDAARYEYILKNDMDEPDWTKLTTGDKAVAITTKGETVECVAPALTNGIFSATSCSTKKGNDKAYTCQIVNGSATNCAKGDKYKGQA